MRAERFTANLHAGQLIQQPRRFAKGRQRRHTRLPPLQASAGALAWAQRQQVIRRTPALPTCCTPVARTREGEATQARLHRTAAPALGGAALTTARTGTPWWTRLRVRSRRGGTHHSSQHRGAFGVPGVQHPLFMHLQTRVSMLPHV